MMDKDTAELQQNQNQNLVTEQPEEQANQTWTLYTDGQQLEVGQELVLCSSPHKKPLMNKQFG